MMPIEKHRTRLKKTKNSFLSSFLICLSFLKINQKLLNRHKFAALKAKNTLKTHQRWIYKNWWFSSLITIKSYKIVKKIDSLNLYKKKQKEQTAL